MSHRTLFAAVALLAAPLAAQTEQFHVDLDQPNNVIGWNVTSSVGSVNVWPGTFKLGGTVELLLDSANAPYSSGALNGALSFTDPDQLNGEIPNPLPFLPPLATFAIKDLEFHLVSPSFTINSLGDFTVWITLTTTAGTNTLGGLFGSGTEPIYDVTSAPTSVNGNISQSGTTITFFLDMNITVTITDPGTGISSDINFNGPLTGFTDSTEVDSFHLATTLPMVVGSNTLSFTGATPSSTVFLAGSAAGLGSVFIAPLNVTLGIASPIQAGATTSDAAGSGSFTLSLPGGASGLSLWLQGVEAGSASNVFGTWVN
ncbi:MAG: hypothetical protein ACYTEP_01310 [Planctomycetota bacterium]|jgi:hypothetical protein